MTDTELPSQRTIEHKNIQKKIKPGTKNDRPLLEYVKYVTMIDWTNAEECKDLPLLPEDFTWPELAQVIGEGKTNWSTVSLLRVSSLYHANCSEIPKLSAEKHLQNIPFSILAPCILMCSWMSKYLQRIGKIGKMQKCYIYCRFLH